MFSDVNKYFIMFYTNTFEISPAILHGHKYESIALAKYDSEHGRGTRR
jgi:hypothetical protein